ncbi:serine O-acetyltransferase [Riemerella columbina]|uniref:serine O-acetyltransferase n=1 Tax=Riemerella columbina TaxID=103810 RepID=UPI000377758A|nr:serine acetyltransferase [Riemerella columbina]
MPTIIQQDFYRECGRYLSFFQIWKKCFSPNLHFIYCFRKAQQYKNTLILGVFWKLVLRHYQIKYGYQIYPETKIGAGFYLGHWGAVVINPKTVIGKNCNIAQGVTIGQQNRGKKQGVPTIGNGVWIGTNAVIVGNITIGDDVLIAPNTYLNADVPAHSVVMGNPAQIIPRDYATEGYINNAIS